MKKSWRTTLAGIATIGVVVCSALVAQFDGDPLSEANWGAVVAAVLAGIGLIAARDNGVSSEEAGVK